MKKMRYIIEAFFSLVAYILLRIMPLDVASAFGGWVAQTLGPRTRVHEVATRNLQTAMPNLTPNEQQNALMKMWNNLGRVFAEYPHIPTAKMRKRLHVVSGENHMRSALESGKPILFISGHLGNWEITPVLANMHGTPLHLLYRQANNPVVDWLIGLIRRPYSRGLYAKGSIGARAVLKAMQQHEPVGMLVDQKTNDGIMAKFFGHDAMTTTVVAQLILKYHPLIIPCRCVRTGGVQFEVIVEEPLTFDLSGDRTQDTLMITQTVNDTLQRWITDDPGQWFWVHKRWPFSKKKRT